MARIFISYRRADSAPYAGRLFDRLRSHFGEAEVFMDLEAIEPGARFEQVIVEKARAAGSVDRADRQGLDDAQAARRHAAAG